MRFAAVSACFAAVLSMGFVTSASALPIDMNPNPVITDFGNGDGGTGENGTITLVNVVNGTPGGGVCATCPAGGDITFIFELSMDLGSDPIASIGVSILDGPFSGYSITGAGSIETGGVDITGVVINASAFGDTGLFTFGAGAGVAAGQTSDQFWVSVASVLGDETESINFMIGPQDGDPDYTIHPAPVITPEPGTALLLAAGMVGLALSRRSSRA
jgi:hypothetical protein